MPIRLRSTPWSRTGCTTCKRRHKKCDGQRPKCRACIRLGLVCEQPDNFCQVRVANSNPGSETFSNKPTPATSTGSEWPDFGVFDALNEKTDTPTADTQDAPLYFEEPSPEFLLPRSIEMFPSFTEVDFHLLQYYTEKLSSCMANADGFWNPLRVLIIPRMLSSTVLFYAVSACAAQHQSMLCAQERKSEFESLATLRYVRSLSALTKLMPSVYESFATSGTAEQWLDENVLLTSIFMCKFEIIKDGMATWRRHLKGIGPLSDHLQSKYPDAMTDTLRFARSFLTYHKCTASLTAGTTEPFEEIVEDELYSDGPDSLDNPEIDLYMGCSQRLFPVLRRVMNLRFLSGQGLQACQIKSKVQNILAASERRLWESRLLTGPEDMTSDTLTSLQHVAEGLANCILVCLHLALDEFASSGDLSTMELDELHQTLPTSKPEALQRCYKSTQAVPYHNQVEAGLLPLLFVIACETEIPELRLEMIARIDNLANSFGIGNQRNASILVRQICMRSAEEGAEARTGVQQIAKWNDLILT